MARILFYSTISAMTVAVVAGGAAKAVASADGMYYAPPASAAAELERDLANALAARNAREALAASGGQASDGSDQLGVAPGNHTAYQVYSGEGGGSANFGSAPAGSSVAYGSGPTGSGGAYGSVPPFAYDPMANQNAAAAGYGGQRNEADRGAAAVVQGGVTGDSAGGGVPYRSSQAPQDDIYGLPWKTSSVSSPVGSYVASVNSAGYMPPPGIYGSVPRERPEHFYRPPQYYRPPAIRYDTTSGPLASAPRLQRDYESYATEIAEPADLDMAVVEPGGFDSAAAEQ